jgi:hypothetical protein
METHTHRFSIAEITGHTENIPITTYVHRPSDDNRRQYREEFPVAQPSPVKCQRVAERTGSTIAGAIPNAPLHGFLAPLRYEMGLDFEEESFGPVLDAEPRSSTGVKPSVRLFA